ncbi:SOUL heme-binding protein [Nannocystis exedens]|uniref:SOUL heme-binding protein n=1 Tax=Nannocystis exedens TaxID=54 RepID=A0A1I1XR19_9BACT|nr:heme-binding protein [Nannocystis exedens]PCC73289.1 SOUL heme-binding protein [Nannocystis exedens]SFE09058.1 SOUL heme-binding protein [Nannocystis exedens]
MLTKIPFTELLKSVPGFFGIRLEEQPKYDVVETIDDVEIRRYQPALLARLTVEGEHDKAVDEAFDRLARYIFGENSKQIRMSMTAPVEQHPEGERLAMTSPVLQKQGGRGWTVAFFLSNDLFTSEAPRPDDPAIELVHEPARTVAALRYRGNSSEDKRKDSRQRLLAALEDHPRWRIAEDVYWAQYDAPFTLPFAKRNEAMVELEPR